MKLQNAQIDSFIDESLNTLALKEIEVSKFLVKQYEDNDLVNKTNHITNNATDASSGREETIKNHFENESNSDIFYSNNHSCFNNLIQFELQPHDHSLNKVNNNNYNNNNYYYYNN